MDVKTNAEKEWLRKMAGGQPYHKEQEAPVRVAATQKENGSTGFSVS